MFGVVACGGAEEDLRSGGATATTGAGGAGPTGATHGAVSASSSAATGGSGGGTAKGPPFPVVLAHGFFGFEEFAGVDFATYFYEVKARLELDGEAVLTPAVDPFNDSAYRGAQLLAFVEETLEQTGHAKVVLVGHSQGGLDARWVAHERPDLVAAVVTISTPHHGTPIADIALKVIDDPALSDVLDFLLQAAGGPLYDQVGDETSLAKPMHLFSQEGIAEFNREITDSPDVRYASLAGRSGGHDGGGDCAPDVVLGFVSAWQDATDPIDPLFAVPEAILDGGLGESIPNDGLVRVKDARWGEFWGCVPADHLDEIGHLFGDGPGFGNEWDHLESYSKLVAHLRALGY
jgi:triacylglycerol lipase